MGMAPAEALAAALRDRELLLVLDNFGRSWERRQRWRTSSPPVQRLAVLVTSQSSSRPTGLIL